MYIYVYMYICIYEGSNVGYLTRSGPKARRIAYCRLYIVKCDAVYCLLSILLSSAYCVIVIIYCLLYIVLYIVYCIV